MTPRKQMLEALNEICHRAGLSRTGHDAAAFREELKQMIRLGFEAARKIAEPFPSWKYETPEDFLRELEEEGNDTPK